MPIEPDSPTVVLNAWNNSKKTELVMLDFVLMCLCKNDIKGGCNLDFRACITPDCQSLSHRGMEKGDAHQRIKLWPSSRDARGTLAIRVPPSTAGQASTTIFSCPLFHLRDLLSIEGEDVQWGIMLRLNLKPHVLKFLFEGYLGAAELTI